MNAPSAISMFGSWARKKLLKTCARKSGAIEEIPLSEDDLVFVTNGSITESSTQGTIILQRLSQKHLVAAGVYGKTWRRNRLSLVIQKSL